MRHEVGGTDLATLAGEAKVSSGAIAMRLARARASLRLEFLLAFRRLDLPTDRCRPVLLALAVGDRRRQAQLDADAHVARCPVCAELVGPMTRPGPAHRRLAAHPDRRGAAPSVACPARPPGAARRRRALIVAATGALFVAGRSPDETRRAGHASRPAATAPASRGGARRVRTAWPRRRRPARLPAAGASADRRRRCRHAGPTTRAGAPATVAPATEAGAAVSAARAARSARPRRRVGCPFAVSVVTVTAVSGDGCEVVTSAQEPRVGRRRGRR